jgi:DNA polymerase I-like protein with 3'-5' exonuclease and polymerase domains
MGEVAPFEIVTREEQFHELRRLASFDPGRVVDIETDGLDWVRDSITGIAIKFTGANRRYYVPLTHVTGNNCPMELARVYIPHLIRHSQLSNHNLKFDRLFLEKSGMWAKPSRSRCTEMALKLYNENEDNFKLKETCDRYGIGVGSIEERVLQEKLASMGYRGTKEVSWKTYQKYLPPEEVAPYATTDCDLAEGLENFVVPALGPQGLLPVLERDMKFWDIICRAEKRGLHIDVPEIEIRIAECTAKAREIKARIEEMLGVDEFNPKSSPQVCKALGVSTSKKDYLATISTPLSELIVEYREWLQARNNYYIPFIELVDEHGFLHCTIWADGTVTARLRVSKPPLQAMPRESSGKAHREKDVFTTLPGRSMVYGDWSQMELRFAAHFAREMKMIQAFLDGRDIHSETALAVHGEVTKETRDGAIGGKRCNFAIVYGTSAKGMSEKTYIPIDRCGQVLRRMQATYPAFKALYNQAQNVARMRGYIRYYSGRIRRFPNREKAYTAMNHLIQGTVGEVCRDTMVMMDESIVRYYGEDNVFIPIQIHDEIQVDCPDEIVPEVLPWQQRIMESWTHLGEDKLLVPMVAEMKVGKSWGKKLSLDKWLQSTQGKNIAV